MATIASPIDSAPSAPPPSSGGAGLEDRMTERFSSALTRDSGSSQTESAPSALPDNPDVTPEVTEPEPSATPADATAAETVDPHATPEIDPYADDDEVEAEPRLLNEILKSPEGQRLYQRMAQGHKFVKELAKPTTEGGIGHNPSVQDVRNYFTAHTNAVAMWGDYTSGDPKRVGNFLGHWFGRDKSGNIRPSSMQALEQLEPALAQIGPEEYSQVATPILQRYKDSIVAKWQTETDPKLKEALRLAAHVLHHDINDEWLANDEAFGAPSAQPANGNGNRTAQERAEIQRQWDQLNAAKHAGVQESVGRWNSQLHAAEQQVLDGEIEKALKPLAAMKTATPEVYNSVKDRFVRQVEAALQSDPELWRLYQARVEQARRTGNPAVIEQVVKNYLNLAVPVIQAKRKPFLKGAGGVVQQQNDASHAQLRLTASKTAPGNSGEAVRQSVVPASKQQDGESAEEYRTRRFKEAMSRR